MDRIIKRRLLFAVIVLGLFFGLANNCQALESGVLLAGNMTDSEFEMFSQNNITFYDPDECLSTGGGGGGGSVGILAGNDNAEKIWNYLAEANITGVSDNAAVISAIIGNFYGETGLNPFIGGTCLGLFQVCQSSGQKEEFRQYLLQNGVTLGIKNPTEDQTNRAIQAELDFLLQKYHGTENFFANLDVVSEKSPESYAELFVVTVERAVCYPGMIIQNIGECHKISQPLNDQAIMNYVRNTLYKSGKYHTVDSYQGIAKRRQYAREIYDKYAGSASIGTSVSSSVSSDHSGVDLSAVTSDITLIGDSISVYSESELMKKFPNSFLNKVGSRHSTTKGWCDGDEGGLSVLKKIVSGSGAIMNQHQGQSKCEAVSVDSSALKENVVWALGTNTNGAKNQSTLEGVLEAIGGRKLYLVTPYNMIPDRMGDTDEIADLYRSFADAHDNVYIIDWNKNVRDNATQYIDNSDHLGVHPTSAGSELFAKLIAEAVSGSKSCTTYEEDYPQYLQCDAKWGSTKYNGSTICAGGCGPASLAMLVTVATGRDVSPEDVAAMTDSPPYYNDFDSVSGEYKRAEHTRRVCEKYGCEVEQLPDGSVETIRKYLKEGWMIHLSGAPTSDAPEASLATNNPATDPFSTPNGHYVGIFSIDGDDNVMIADPAGDSHPGFPGRFNREMTLTQATARRWTKRPIMAIRGKGGNSGKNTCEVVGNYCAGEGGEGGSSGATISGEGDQPIGPFSESSENVACDPRTTDIGVRDDGFFKGKRMKIRLCALDKPGYEITSDGGEEHGRHGVTYSGAHAIVNSRVSGAYAGLAARYIAENGKPLNASSSFRTNAHQSELKRGCKGCSEADVASPGRSKHQTGLAVDIATLKRICGYGKPSACDSKSSLSRWLGNNVGDFGLDRPNGIEAWHVEPPYGSQK